MNIKSLLTCFLALAATASFAQSSPTPGYVGSLTMAFTIAYSDTKDQVVSTNTSTAYKSVTERPVSRVKYGNKEFITDLISSGFLTPSTAAADWSLKMLVIYNSPIYIYAVHKSGTITYVGNATGDSGAAIGIGPTDAFYVGGSTTISAKRINHQTLEETTTDVINGQSALELFFGPTSETHAYLHGLFTQNLTTTLKLMFATDTQSTDIKIKTVGFTNLVGGANLLGSGRGDLVITGSILATSFKLVPNVENYLDARF